MFSCNLCVTLLRDIMIKAEEAEEQTVKLDIDPMPTSTVSASPIEMPRLFTQKQVSFHVVKSNIFISDVLRESDLGSSAGWMGDHLGTPGAEGLLKPVNALNSVSSVCIA